MKTGMPFLQNRHSKNLENRIKVNATWKYTDVDIQQVIGDVQSYLMRVIKFSYVNARGIPAAA